LFHKRWGISRPVEGLSDPQEDLSSMQLVRTKWKVYMTAVVRIILDGGCERMTKQKLRVTWCAGGMPHLHLA